MAPPPRASLTPGGGAGAFLLALGPAPLKRAEDEGVSGHSPAIIVYARIKGQGKGKKEQGKWIKETFLLILYIIHCFVLQLQAQAAVYKQ